ncbi:MAG: hypothetical protein AAF909_13470 [Pseudomonadota bacterium]
MSIKNLSNKFAKRLRVKPVKLGLRAAAPKEQPFTLGAEDGLWRATANRRSRDGDAGKSLPEVVHPHD